VEETKKAEKKRDDILRYRVFQKLDHKNMVSQITDKNYKGYLDPAKLKSEKEAAETAEDAKYVPLEERKYFDISKDEFENSTIGQHILAGSNRIYILSTIVEMMNAVIYASFALWFLSSAVFSFGIYLPIAITKTGIF